MSLVDAATPVLETERLYVRPALAGDVPAIVAFYRDNRQHLAPWEPLRPRNFHTDKFWKGQVERLAEEWRAGRGLRLFLFPKARPTKVIGNIGVSNIVRGVAQYANVGYAIAEREQGKGLMREALQATIAHAFGPMNLHRLMANYMPRNEPSGALLRRLGFVVEGYARDYILIAGRWEDHVMTSLTSTEWKSS